METPTSISEWANVTFGVATSNRRIACRANEEMAELLRALSVDDNHPKAAEETADVAIVLVRLFMRLGYTVSFEQPEEALPKDLASNLSLATEANEKLAYLINCLSWDDALLSWDEVDRDLVQGIMLCCKWLVMRFGSTLQVEIDKKMVINRTRVWQTDGSGFGYHVR